ncbi:MAG: holo-ACP synthase [Rhodocyclaceae bacterium]|nr:holo-ACP synthase [Rhodocyclaceae bacterium]MBX3668383.1 holo-ACP synthase [Rhodocyclaceae bacterium]
MIAGIGTDIAQVARFERLLAEHGERFALRVLGETELEQFRSSRTPARFLAKRFAAKEAFAKAFGTGIRPPATLHAICVGHADLGRPILLFAPELDAEVRRRGLRCHVSISDEADYAVAFVILETD